MADQMPEEIAESVYHEIHHAAAPMRALDGARLSVEDEDRAARAFAYRAPSGSTFGAVMVDTLQKLIDHCVERCNFKGASSLVNELKGYDLALAETLESRIERDRDTHQWVYGNNEPSSSEKARQNRLLARASRREMAETRERQRFADLRESVDTVGERFEQKRAEREAWIERETKRIMNAVVEYSQSHLRLL